MKTIKITAKPSGFILLAFLLLVVSVRSWAAEAWPSKDQTSQYELQNKFLANTPHALSNIQALVNKVNFNQVLAETDSNTLFKRSVAISLPKVVISPARCFGLLWWRWCSSEVVAGPYHANLMDLEVSLVSLSQDNLEINAINVASGDSYELGEWDGISLDGTLSNVNFGLEVKSRIPVLTHTAQTILNVLNLQQKLDVLDGNFVAQLNLEKLNFKTEVGFVDTNGSSYATLAGINAVGLEDFLSDFSLNIDLPESFNVFGFGIAQSVVDQVTYGLTVVKDFLIEAKILRHVGPALAEFVSEIIFGDTGASLIEVNFAKAETPKSMIGFLHGLPNDETEEEFLTPLLKADISWRIRSTEDQVAKAKQYVNGKPVIVVTDTWNGQAPARDWSAWEDHVRQLAMTFGDGVIYDIINEPDNPLFWTADNGHHPTLGWADMHETFKRSHDVIHEVFKQKGLQEEPIISGPSFTLFWGAEERLYSFVQYCQDNNIKMPIIAVHLLYQPDPFLGQIEKTLRQYRHDFIESGQYANVGVKEIHVNEYGMPKIYVRPGSMLAALATFENAGVDAANRATWAVRSEECENIPVCYVRFLVDPPSYRLLLTDLVYFPPAVEGETVTPLPRPVWWVYKHYADGVSSRVNAVTHSRFLMPIASSASENADQAQLMIGAHSSQLRSSLNTIMGKTPENISVVLKNLDHLSFVSNNTQQLDIEVKKIINSETQGVVSLDTVMETSVAIGADGSAILSLEPLGDFEAYVVLMQ